MILINVIANQKRIGMKLPNQKTNELQAEATLTFDDSKHHFYIFASPIFVYHLKATNSLPAMFFVTQKSKLRSNTITIKVERY